MKKGFTLAGATHVALPKNNRKVAFTLAEVLITLGIIGVVAALTLPPLIQDKIIKQRVSQLKKVYSALSQAYVFAVNEHGTPDTWGMKGLKDSSSHKIMASNFRPYLKILQDCIDLPDDQVKRLCSPNISDYSMFSSVVLSDGTLVNFRNWEGECKGNFSGESDNQSLKRSCGLLQVDLNGRRKPNRSGEDIFSFYLTNNGVIPFGVDKSAYTFEKGCNTTIQNPYPSYSPGNMFACAAWVIYNENMDYLKCNDLSWDGKKKCK